MEDVRKPWHCLGRGKSWKSIKSWWACIHFKGVAHGPDHATNIRSLRMNKGMTQVKARHMDKRGFKEADLSNPDKDQDLEFGGSEREDIPRVGSNWWRWDCTICLSKLYLAQLKILLFHVGMKGSTIHKTVRLQGRGEKLSSCSISNDLHQFLQSFAWALLISDPAPFPHVTLMPNVASLPGVLSHLAWV